LSYKNYLLFVKVAKTSKLLIVIYANASALGF